MSRRATTVLGPGTIVAGRYCITGEIGRGGMAHVYEAEHIGIGKRVAMKVLSGEFVGSKIVVERFLREARAAAAVRSPHLCDVFDSGQLEDQRPFLVMELLEGETLYDLMVRQRRLDPATITRVIGQVARGLTKAHAAGIVHRDLKPENIFLTSNEEGEIVAKVLDFGLAKFYAPLEAVGAQARLTREGAIFGTPAYMSPEQVKGQGTVDQRADLWALGCIVYECLTGRTVWETEQGMAMTFAQIASAPLPDLAHERPDLPSAIGPWFERALLRDIDQRFQSARAFADALAEALGQSLPARDGSQPGRTTRTSEHDVPPGQTALRPSSTPGRSPTPSDGGTGRSGELHDVGVTQAEAARAGRAAATGSGAGPLASKDDPSRQATLSIGDIGTASTVEGMRAGRGRGGTRVAIAAVAALLLMASSVGAWRWIATRQARGSAKVSMAGLPAGSASASPAPSASTLPAASPTIQQPRWVSLLGGGQAQLSAGNVDAALRSFRDALDASGSAEARMLGEHLSAAQANTGPCRLHALGRLRPHALTTGFVSRPTLVRARHSLLAVWADDHESPGRSHGYVGAYDDALRPLGPPIDISPEAEDVGHLAAFATGDRVAVLYADRRGAKPGLFVRWLESDGRIAGPALTLGTSRASNATPAVAAAGDDAVWALWDEEREPGSDDLFARRIMAEGAPSIELRLTDFALRGRKTRAVAPDLGMSAGALQVLFRLDRDTSHVLDHLFVTSANDRTSGLPPASPGGRGDRVVGQLHTLVGERDHVDSPSLACSDAGCFATWRVDRGANAGAHAAYLDAKTGQLIWRKRFAPLGTHPSVGMALDGSARLAWFEAGRVRLAQLGREGVGPSSIVAHVAGDQPAPSLAASNEAGEWALGWLDFEAGRLEPYALRATCPPPLPVTS